MHISILHLLWIVPVSAICGYIAAALFFMAHEETHDDTAKHLMDQIRKGRVGI